MICTRTNGTLGVVKTIVLIQEVVLAKVVDPTLGLVDVIVIAQDDQSALEVTKGALGHAKTDLVLAPTQGNFGCQKT